MHTSNKMIAKEVSLVPSRGLVERIEGMPIGPYSISLKFTQSTVVRVFHTTLLLSIPLSTYLTFLPLSSKLAPSIPPALPQLAGIINTCNTTYVSRRYNPGLPQHLKCLANTVFPY